MIRGLFPLSADPIHFGHLDIIQQAADQCAELVVAVLDSDDKQGHYTFSQTDRVCLVERALKQIALACPVRVLSSKGLLADLFLREGCDKVFRGIRNQKDQEYEAGQMRLHDVVLPGFSSKVEYLSAKERYRHISSSCIKAMVMHGVDVSSMCPLFVKSKLERTLRDLYFIGVTGGMGVGKSWVCRKLAADLAMTANIEVCVVQIDEIMRHLYAESTPGAQRVRDNIKAWTGAEITVTNGTADLTALKAAIAAGLPEGTMQHLHNLTEPHVYRLLRESLAGRRGLVLLEWARLVEDGMAPLVNNDVLVVTSPNQAAQIASRGTNPEFAAQMLANQTPVGDLERWVRRRIEAKDCGSLMVYENASPELGDLPQKVLKLFPGLKLRDSYP